MQLLFEQIIYVRRGTGTTNMQQRIQGSSWEQQNDELFENLKYKIQIGKGIYICKVRFRLLHLIVSA